MKIQLIEEVEIDEKGNEKITKSKTYFSKKRLRGSDLQRTLSAEKKISDSMKEEGFTEGNTNTICEYICDYFGNQFTAEELLDGIYLEDLLVIYNKISQEVSDRYLMKIQDTIKK